MYACSTIKSERTTLVKKRCRYYTLYWHSALTPCRYTRKWIRDSLTEGARRATQEQINNTRINKATAAWARWQSSTSVDECSVTFPGEYKITRYILIHTVSAAELQVHLTHNTVHLSLSCPLTTTGRVWMKSIQCSLSASFCFGSWWRSEISTVEPSRAKSQRDREISAEKWAFLFLVVVYWLHWNLPLNLELFCWNDCICALCPVRARLTCIITIKIHAREMRHNYFMQLGIKKTWCVIGN